MLMLNDLKQELLNRNNISPDVIEDIVIAADTLIDYFGTKYQNQIFNAILNCNFKLESSDKNNVTYKSTPKISQNNNQYIITDINRNIYIKKNNDISTNFMGNLVHTLLHLVKSYAVDGTKEFVINNNKVIQTSGLIKEKYNIIKNNDNYELKLEEQRGIGLEKSVNLYQVLTMMRIFIDDEYDLQSFDNQRILGGHLLDKLNMKAIIEKTELTGDETELKAFIEEKLNCSYDYFLELFDKALLIDLKIYNNLSHEAELANLQNESAEIFNKISQTLYPLLLNNKIRYN